MDPDEIFELETDVSAAIESPLFDCAVDLPRFYEPFVWLKEGDDSGVR